MLCRHKHCLQTYRNEIPHDLLHLAIPSGASKMIFEPMVRSAQIVHLSCIKICTISIQTEMSIHLSLVTLEYPRVRLKGFLSLWYVWHKLCNYLALTQALSPNGPKRDSTWCTSPSNSIVCVQNGFVTLVRLAQTKHQSLIKSNTISKQTEKRFLMTHVT
jgi:hypothetical protein